MEITIDIYHGQTTVSVKGVKGKSCKALTESFEKSLGKKISDTPTPEMMEPEETEKVRQR